MLQHALADDKLTPLLGPRIVGLDHDLFFRINGAHNAFFDGFFGFITNFGNFMIPLVIVGLGILVFGSWRLRQVAILCLVAVLLADMMGQNLKISFDRLRPYWLFGSEFVRVPGGSASSRSFSMPSNHAINCFSVATIMCWYYWRRWWVPAVSIAAATLVAYSRIYVGSHFPIDAVGGAFLGAAIATGLVAVAHAVPMVREQAQERPRLLPLGILVLALILLYAYRYSFIYREVFPLSPEEAQYWDWSRRLDLSYYSKPPLLAYLLRLSTEVFGHTQFAVRGVAVTLAACMTVAGLLMVRQMYRDPWVVTAAVVMLTVMPLFSIGAVISTTDTPMMFFWVLTCWALYRALLCREAPMWYVAGVLFGFGLLGKYAMVYIIPCLAVLFLLAPEHRHWLRRREPWLFLAIGGLMFLPVIVWSARHDWVNFLHVSRQAKVDDGLRIDIGAIFGYVGGQAAIASPVAFIFVLWRTWLLLHTPAANRDPRSLFLVALGAPVFVLLLIKSIQGEVLGNWAAPAYFTWMIFAAVEFVALVRARWAERQWRPGLVALGAGALLPPAIAFVAMFERNVYLDLAEAVHKPTGRQLPAKLDPYFQFAGWNEVGDEVSRVIASMPNPERTFIFSNRYQLSATLAFYVEGNPGTYCVNLGRRMNQYDIWGGIGERKGWDAIFVRSGRDEVLTDRITENFDHTDPPIYVVSDQRRTKLPYRTFTIHRLYGFDGTIDRADSISSF